MCGHCGVYVRCYLLSAHRMVFVACVSIIAIIVYNRWGFYVAHLYSGLIVGFGESLRSPRG